MATIITLDHLQKLSETFHQQGKRIVLVGGCFDLLHYGHITFLEDAKKQGDILLVLLESDAMVKKRKGIDRPIHTQQQRAHMIAGLRSVDGVILLPSLMQDTDYDTIVNTVKPAIIAATKGDPGASHKERQAAKSGAQLVFVNDRIPHLSTSKLITILEKEF